MDKIQIHVSTADLIVALDRISSVISSYNFLFVNLDSSTFRRFKNFDDDIFGDVRLDSNGQRVYSITSEGMWVKGEYIRELVMSSNFAPRFNAAYIFDKSISKCDPPTYTDTSECVQFSSVQPLPKELEASLKKMNACGYLSDGTGLNILLLDKKLIEVWNSTDWGEGNEEIN